MAPLVLDVLVLGEHVLVEDLVITMLGTIRFVLVNIFISCELIYVTDDYNACPFLLINLSGAKTVFAAIANSSVGTFCSNLGFVCVE